jgi:hypothetical protein
MSPKKRKVSFQEIREMGRQMLDEHGLHDWEFSVGNLSNPGLYGNDVEDIFYKRIATCVHQLMMIELDWNFWVAKKHSRAELRQTILHEIAHALLPPNAKHGSEWITKARELGCAHQHLRRYRRELERSPNDL